MDKTSLLSALRICKPGLGQKSQIVGLDCYYFPENGHQVITYNGTLTVVASLGNSNFPVHGCINGNTLYKLITEFPDNIELSVKDKDLILKAGGARSKLPIVIAEPKLFDIPEIATTDSRLPRSALFYNGIKECMISVNYKSNDAGIMIFVKDKVCELYSTDGSSTFSKFEFLIEEDNVTDSLATVLPAMFCEQYLSMSMDLMSIASEIAIGDGYIRAIFSDKAAIFCSFYSAPTKQSLRNKINDCIENVKLVKIPEDLHSLLKRSEIIAMDGTNSIEIKYGKMMEVHATGLGGLIDESIELEYESEGTINVDIRLLKRGMDAGASEVGFGNGYLLLKKLGQTFYHIIAGKV